MLGGVVFLITERGRRVAGEGLLRPLRIFNEPFNMLKKINEEKKNVKALFKDFGRFD